LNGRQQRGGLQLGLAAMSKDIFDI
jgi:hypothetical protein